MRVFSGTWPHSFHKPLPYLVSRQTFFWALVEGLMCYRVAPTLLRRQEE